MMKLCLRALKERESEEERLFMDNGSRLLEELITTCNGKSNPIRTFSAKELEKATNKYENRVSQEDRGYAFYKGALGDGSTTILVKKYLHNKLEGDHKMTRKALEDCVNEVVIASQMSHHRNVLQLLGCCLETRVPIQVYEFAPKVGPGPGPGPGRLYYHIFEEEEEEEEEEKERTSSVPLLLSWESRLRIAMELADVLTYMHTAFSRPIIHRHIKAWNVFLDQHGVAKLTDFTLSKWIPLGETYVEDTELRGTYGFNAPEYLYTGRLTQKTDVFSFGMLLLELITGQRSVIIIAQDHRVWLLDYVKSFLESGRACEIVAPTIKEEGGFGRQQQQQQLQAFLELAMRCTRDSEEERPTMMEVAKELRRIPKFALS